MVKPKWDGQNCIPTPLEQCLHHLPPGTGPCPLRFTVWGVPSPACAETELFPEQLLILAPAHSQPLKRAYKNVHIYVKGMTLTLRYIHSHGRNFFLYYCWKETTWAIAHNRLQYINVEISIWAPTLHGWTSCLAIPPGFSYQRHFTPFKYNLYQTSLNIISRVIR